MFGKYIDNYNKESDPSAFPDFFFTILMQCSPYQAETGKIYRFKQQQATVLTAYTLLMVY